MNLKSLATYLMVLFSSIIFYGQTPDNNMLDTSTWTIGTGGVTGFTKNGSTTENIRELGLDHLGNEVILWKASPDASNNADGGWATSWFNIDRTKTYRISVWIKKTNSNDGTTYFGCNKYNGDQMLNLDGTLHTNPYFWHGDLPSLDRWYLLVGFVHEENHSSTVHQGRIYDGVTGEAVVTIKDFKFNSNATTLRQRAFLYYDTNTNDRQYFYAPRMELVDGTEWTIDQLLSINPDSQLLFSFDVAGNQTQRFYCSEPGCNVPVPPSIAPPSNEESVVVKEESETLKEDVALDRQIVLYPNPTKGIVSLKLETNSDVSIERSINIYNSNGTLVDTVNSQSKNGMEIDLSSFPTGTYFIHIHLSNGESVTKKIVKN